MIRVEEVMKYLGMEYYVIQKFYEVRMVKIEVVVKMLYIIEFKVINNYFFYIDIFMEYFDYCVKFKLLYVC